MSLRRSGAIANPGQPIKANRPDECQMATAAGQCMRRRHDRASSRWLRGVAAMVWVVAAAVTYMRQVARTVVVVGTSRGTLRVPASLSARPDGIVLTSGFLDNVR